MALLPSGSEADLPAELGVVVGPSDVVESAPLLPGLAIA